MSSSTSNEYIDNLLAQVTAAPSVTAQHQIFKRDLPEASLLAFLSDGQDPLPLLDPRRYTLPLLYILSARLHANFGTTIEPSYVVVQEFCRYFEPKHAQMAPERVTKLAKGIYRMAAAMGSVGFAVIPLRHLVMRYPPSASYLTTIHPLFTLACVSTRMFEPALSVLANPITEIDTSLCPDLTYQDNLQYHYTGGIALAALKRWKEAEEYFEICVTSPGTYPAALQMEALKKLRLVQLIATGALPPLPKYTHPQLVRLYKGTVYNAFANAYPRNTQAMQEVFEKEHATFAQDKNVGLVQQALAAAPRWVLKKLTATYVTLHLGDIARAVQLASEEDVRSLLLDMIEAGDISATIAADGTVTFADPPAQFSRAQVENVLRTAQEQAALLSYLELEVGRSKEFLNKAVKTTDSSWSTSADEEIFANLGGQAMWEENIYS